MMICAAGGREEGERGRSCGCVTLDWEERGGTDEEDRGEEESGREDDSKEVEPRFARLGWEHDEGAG